MLTPNQIIYDGTRSQVGRLRDGKGNSFIRKVGNYAVDGELSAAVDFLSDLKERPHANLLVPIDFRVDFEAPGSGVLVEDYHDLTERDKLDAVDHAILSDLAKGRRPLAHVLDFMVQISDGVGFIHSNGFVHMDVRSPNVFVQRESERIVPTLFDYDLLTRPFFLQEGRRRANIETPPEEMRGQVEVGPRHDVYQLGWMLRHLTHIESGVDVWKPVVPLDVGITKIIDNSLGPLENRYADAGEIRDRLAAIAG